MPLNRALDMWHVLIDKTFAKGRPLGLIFPSMAAMLGFNVAGIPGVHFIGYLIVFFNGFFAYKIISHCYDKYLALFAV